MRDPTPQITRLKDYTPPAFLVETVDLDVDLFEDHARVRSRLCISRNPKAKDTGASLVLDAEDLEFESASLDGRELAAGELVLDDAHPDDEVRTVVLSRSGPTPEGAPTSRVRVDAGDSSAQRRHWAGRRTVSHAAHACCIALCIA